MSGSFCIACFGDSLTEGFGLRASQALPSVLESLLRDRGFDVRCHNFGVSGDTAGDGLQRLKKVLQAKPDLCIVAFGANDFFLGLEPGQTDDDLAAILEGLAACKIPALLAGVRCLAEFGEEYKREFDMIFPHLAERFGVALLPDLLSLYLRDPMKVLIDQIHPNEQGVRSMAEALAPLVEAELAKRR
ncbi:GDSL-type esterase/lipase family protein [Paucidesulfovibrio longus]|uniref:GDSL-type esterase/lipase family protein n=1 Tax=Paucidesulfovibrio longus TaxID=889 RepID=UPI0003B6BE59|nr:GDSL-type esterase/lipase family protein [Paucidesulfovibrio longus]